MNKSEKFWNKIAPRYSRQAIADEASYQKKLKKTREYLNVDMDMFEFGCGTGTTAIIHAPYVKHIHAIDLSPKMLEIVQGKVDKENINNITFEQSTIDEFNAPDNSFDVVLGMSILHLLENKEEAVAKVYKMLKSGGIFISSTACLGDMMFLFKLIAPLGKITSLIPIIRVFSKNELVESLMDIGFSIDYQWKPGKNKAAFIVAKKPV
ncbi:MAG: methyltransferase domain-containing protein [Gammaproteobacteria bacterium]